MRLATARCSIATGTIAPTRDPSRTARTTSWAQTRPRRAARRTVSQHSRGGRERLGLLQPLDARSDRPPHARDDGSRAGRSQQPAVSRRADDRRAAAISPPRGRRCRWRAFLPQRRTRAAARFSPSAYDSTDGFFYDVRWRTGERVTRPSDLGRGRAALLRARDGRAGTRRRDAPRARFSKSRRIRHDAGRVGPAVGRAQRVAAAAVARDRRRSALWPRRPRRTARDRVARACQTHLRRDTQDDGEVRRHSTHEARGRRRVSHAGWIRLDERRRARSHRALAVAARARTRSPPPRDNPF